jgi:hypothetical protein
MKKPLYTLTRNFLSDEECDELRDRWKFYSVGHIQHKEAGNVYNPNSRIVDLSLLDESHPVFEKGRQHFESLKEQYGLSDLGRVSYNFLRYKVGGKFNKHTDVMMRDQYRANRQLSMTIQLSEGHKGGEFVIYKPGREEGKVVPLEKGSAVSFRSEILHQVNPVLEGERTVLVLWFMTKPKKMQDE